MIEYGYNSIIIRSPDKNKDTYKKFHKRMSTWDGVRYKYTNPVYREFNDDLFLPYTIGLDTVKYYFKDKKTIFNPNLITRARNISYEMVNKPKNSIQEESIKFLTSMTTDQFNRNRFLSLNTGDGKTFVTIYSSSIISKTVMVIVDSVDLAEQWKKEFVKHTDMDEDDIYMLSGMDSVNKAEEEFHDKKVYIAIHRTLQMIINNNPSSLPILLNKLGIGVRIFDECHVEFNNICSINAFSNVEYSIYLTATPNRTKFTEDRQYKLVFKDIPFYNGKILTEDTKYHFVYLAKMNTRPSDKQKVNMKTNHGFSIPRWASYIENEKYDVLKNMLEYILDERLKLHENDYKTAIVFPTISLIEKVYDDLNDTKYGSIGKFIGSVPKKKRLDELKHKLILTNDKMLGKGLDDSYWDGDLEVMINFVPMSSHVKLEQLIGRLRYKKGKKHLFVDVTDKGFVQTKNQLRKRKTFYNKKAKTILDSKKIIENDYKKGEK
jgi:ERCC4-related helicase